MRVRLGTNEQRDRGRFPRPIWAAVAMASGLAFMASPSFAVDWNAVEGKTITLFAPGQASWEWALTQSDHSGAGRFREGRNCKHCHDGEQKEIGDLIVAAQGRGAALEPKPVPGKPGAIDLNVKTAHDGENLHVRLQWREVEYDGEKMDPDNAARVTMMIDDGTVRESARAGCWGTCHDDAMGMASDPNGVDLTKYIFASRTGAARTGGGENYKSDAELQELLQNGMFMEYWQARLNHNEPAQAVVGYILDRRHEGADRSVRADAQYQPSAQQKLDQLMAEDRSVRADAQFDAGTWTVVLSRPLQSPGPGHKDIAPGKTYNVGFAVHNNYTDHRFHHVSLEYTLTLDGGSGDLVASKR
jgi:hypothetical protein